MIGHVKPSNGRVLTLGSDRPRRTILLQGSCRSLPYVNYFVRYLRMTGDSLRVYCIDPNDNHWDESGAVTDFEAALLSQETNPHILDAIRSADVFLHEHYANFGMFNSSPAMEKNIFQFGMKPEQDICIPNFHDLFILYNDIIAFDADIQRRVAEDGGIPKAETLRIVREMGVAAVNKFCDVCRQSSFPEMGEYFRENWTRKRFFWTMNHITRHFSLYIFWQLNDRFLHLDLSEQFWRGAESEDLFRTPYTKATPFDVANHGLTWEEM